MKYVPPYGVTSNPDASYINGDPSIGRQGSIPPGAAIENPQREIVNLIADAGQSPTDQDLQQLTRGVRDGRLNFCVDSGPLNQLQVVLPGPALQAYTGGLVLNVLVAHTNTGPTRISVGTLNPTSVKRPDGAELQANDLLAGMVAVLVCDGTYFQCINIGTGETGGGDTSIFQVDIPYVHDTGVANHLIGLYSPPLADIREGRTVEIKLAANVTGPTDFKPNNFPIHNVVHPDGSPLVMGDGLIGQIWLLVFDGVNWQLLGISWAAAPTVPATPAITTGKSLQFLYSGFNQSSHLIRSPSQNGNRQVWTVSMFVRRMNTDSLGQPYPTQAWFAAGGAEMSSDYTGMYFTDTAYNYVPAYYLWWNNSYGPVAGPGGPGFSNPTFQDIKWHHFLMNADGAHISAYTDGVLVAQGAANGNGAMCSTRPHMIGADADDLGQYYGSNVRMAEIYLVDGLCLDWTKFSNNVGGIMLPKTYGGAFGLNGSYLNWNDSSAATETTLGKDWSGNNNNWLPFNLSISQVSTDYPR